MKFTTLEEAEAHIAKQDNAILSLKEEKEIALREKKDAQTVAEDLLSQISKLEEQVPKQLTVTVDKKKYEVLFGVDGLTKEELATDKALLAKLVKFNSGALKLLED
jgi:hypothetical protein